MPTPCQGSVVSTLEGDYGHFTDGETEAKGNAVICVGSDGLDVGAPVFIQMHSDPRCVCLATLSCVLAPDQEVRVRDL